MILTHPLLLALSFVGAAQEEKPLLSDSELQEIVRKAVPAVERVVGARFKSEPKVRLSTREEMEKALADELVAQMKVLQPGATEDEARRSAGQLARVYGEMLVGKYAWKPGVVHLLPETLRRLAKLLEEPKLLDRAILRVIVTHELVHALDQQEFGVLGRIGEAKSSTEIEVLNALVEGHAQHVTRRIFDGAGEGSAFETYEKLILAGPASLGEAEKYVVSILTASLKFAYLDGRAFFDALEKTGRKTYAPDAFRNPPASKNVVLHPERFYETPAPPGKAFDPGPAFDAFAQDFGADWTRLTRELDESLIRAAFGDFVDAKEVDAALKGILDCRALVMSPKKADDGKSVIVSVMRTADAAAARKVYDLSLELSKTKDKRLATGQFRITKADYSTISLPEATVHTLARKKVSVPNLEISVVTLIGTTGEFEFEIILGNEDLDDARIQAMARRLCEALRKK